MLNMFGFKLILSFAKYVSIQQNTVLLSMEFRPEKDSIKWKDCQKCVLHSTLSDLCTKGKYMLAVELAGTYVVESSQGWDMYHSMCCKKKGICSPCTTHTPTLNSSNEKDSGTAFNIIIEKSILYSVVFTAG